MQITAILNQKGGVGKSTTAHALHAGLIRRGHRALLVDLDAQGNLSYTMNAPEGAPSSMDLLTRGQAAILHTPYGDLIPASPTLAGADMVLTETGKEYRLREALAPLSNTYDHVILDTPPALGILTVCALTASNFAIIPAQADVYSLQGIGQLYATLGAVRRYTNPQLAVLGVLLTRYNGRAILSRDMADMIEATARQLETTLFETRIRECMALKEAQASRLPIFEYAPKCNAAVDYEAFVGEVLERSARHGQEKL